MTSAFAERSALVASSLALPIVVSKGLWNSDWRRSLPERFGRGEWRAANLHTPLWLHAASVGEVGGLVPLARAIRERWAAHDLLVTTTSLTGRAEAVERTPAGAVCLLPFDHPLIVGRLLDRLQPRLLVISETELWPNLLFGIKQRGIPALLVNGRISDYSFPRYLKLRRFVAPAMQVFSRVLTQTALDAERFEALGVPAERLSVCGCTKFDQEMPVIDEGERRRFALELGLNPDAPCLVAGSVRKGEDETVLRAYLQVRSRHPEIQLIIAPRHPDRFDAVAALLAASGVAYNRRSAGAAAPAPVVLLDTMGELRRCYALGAAAFVGGSLVDIGGHNPLEPAAYQKPVLVGPYTSTVRDAVSAMKAVGALTEAQSEPELAMHFDRILSDPAGAARRGQAGYEVFKRNLGATQRVLSYIEPFL